MIEGYACESILGKAIDKGLLQLRVTDVRDYAPGKHRVCDDAPYGGGAGMVMKVEPLVLAIEDARRRLPNARVCLMSPRGQVFHQKIAKAWAPCHELILVCGRYEGVDERVMHFVDDELSIGDFVLTGGELAALVVIDSVARLVPGVLGNEYSTSSESFEGPLLEYPQYTRPVDFRGFQVPLPLLSGNHERIANWRRRQALLLTMQRRPDLLSESTLSEEDEQLLKTSEEAL